MVFSAIKDWVEDKATTVLRAGIEAGGNLAGNAVGSVGSLVETSGQAAGDAVSGRISGVGNTINGYGNGLKTSMSADGPVSGGSKKTAVKPASGPTAVKRPANAAKKPTTAAKASTVGTQRPPGKPVAAKAGSGGARPRPVGQSAAVKTSTVPKPVSKATGVQRRTAPSGKTVISPESRPGPRKATPGARTATAAARKHDAKDPLGIGANFGQLGQAGTKKSTSQGQKSFSQSLTPNPRKPSAADPLALGDLANVGKNKK